MKTITVNIDSRNYPIYIGNNLLINSELLSKHIVGKQVFIVSNSTVASYYLDTLLATCQGYKTDFILLPDGEQYKTLTVLNRVFDQLLLNHHHRDTTILALGGGVIGDMAGFAAACYQRGVPFIQIPTTLLAQVDASVGGKTAVNHRLGKNMIGAFYQPKAVVIDLNTLKTLPEREFRAGLSEVVKYGLIQDANFFNWMEQSAEAILQKEMEPLAWMVQRCCEIKSNIVAEDETEKGIRALLNLGHTFAHAIESVTHYQRYLHGEAVSIGLCLAANLSYQMQSLSASDCERIKQLLLKLGLPVSIPADLYKKQIITAMGLDKKNIGGQRRFILLNQIGNGIIHDQILHDVIEQVLV
ncbi:MAG: 3-dehydroquinate synthase [Proteobacteria bacterium]|nr:3-dehydroquinate synthase [Pseudomonadota bacterium]